MFEKRVYVPGILDHRYFMILILVGQISDFCLDYYSAGNIPQILFDDKLSLCGIRLLKNPKKNRIKTTV